jgi:uncharacterized membrane protein
MIRPKAGDGVISWAPSGPEIGVSTGSLILGAAAGIVGALIGTFGGRGVRAKLAGSFGNDPPAAFIEDMVAIVAALAIVMTHR